MDKAIRLAKWAIVVVLIAAACTSILRPRGTQTSEEACLRADSANVWIEATDSTESFCATPVEENDGSD